MGMLFHLKQTLIAADQAVNAVLFGGWADESISARCHRQRKDHLGWEIFRFAVNAVFLPFGQPDHCKASYESEQSRMESPPEYRKTN